MKVDTNLQFVENYAILYVCVCDVTVYKYQDIAFLVDSSIKPDSGKTSWTNILDFVNNVIYSTFQTCNNLSCHQFALIQYSDDAKVQFNLSSPSNASGLSRTVSSIAYAPGIGSNLAGALDVVRTQVLNKDNRRVSASAIAIVITDNLPSTSNTPDLQSAVFAAKTAGIRLLVVGINASRTDINTANQVGLYNDVFQSLVIMASNYSQLASNVDRVAQTVIKSLPWGNPASGTRRPSFLLVQHEA